MNYGEVLSYITRMGKTKVKPFKAWNGSQIKDWEFEIELLDVGQNIEISNAVVNFPLGTIPWIIKAELLARCIIKINNEPFVTQEQLDAYNKEHNLDGENVVSLLEYKKILIRKWDQVVVNKLEDEYNRLDVEHQTRLLGGNIPPENLQEKEKQEAEKVVEKVAKEIKKVEDLNLASNPDPAVTSLEAIAFMKKKEDEQ